MSVLKPEIIHQIAFHQNKLINEQVVPWLLHFKNGSLSITRFDGKKITCGGAMEFSGSVRELYWHGYIEPFLDDFTIRIVKSIEEECLKNDLNLEIELRFLSDNLLKMYTEIYKKMADVDQKLRGNGYPSQASLKDTGIYIVRMRNFLDDYISMVIKRNSKKKGVKNYIIRMWKDPVWSKIISALILFLGPLIYYFIDPYLLPLYYRLKSFIIS